MRPLFLSSSYFVFDPFGTSMTTGTRCGTSVPRATSCHGCMEVKIADSRSQIAEARRACYLRSAVCYLGRNELDESLHRSRFTRVESSDKIRLPTDSRTSIER